MIPAYNEAGGLEAAVEAARSVLTPLGSCEILLAVDRSTDGTEQVAARLAELHPEARHIQSDRRLGKGASLRRAFLESRGEILAFMDADLATEVAYLRPLIETVRSGADIAVGSRGTPGARAERATSRRFLSAVYNGWVRLWLRSSIRDHQCGFKAFRRGPLLPLLNQVRATRWFWDTELLVRAQRSGMAIAEIPVTWREQKHTRLRPRDVLRLGWNVVALRWRLARERPETAK